jgi:hypothetical protein
LKNLTFPFCTLPKIEKILRLLFALFQKLKKPYFSFLHSIKNEEFYPYPLNFEGFLFSNTGTDRDGDSGAGLTLHHHSLDSDGGHEMVQQHLTLPVECLQTSSVLS